MRVINTKQHFLLTSNNLEGSHVIHVDSEEKWHLYLRCYTVKTCKEKRNSLRTSKIAALWPVFRFSWHTGTPWFFSLEFSWHTGEVAYSTWKRRRETTSSPCFSEFSWSIGKLTDGCWRKRSETTLAMFFWVSFAWAKCHTVHEREQPGVVLSFWVRRTTLKGLTVHGQGATTRRYFQGFLEFPSKIS